MAGKLRRVLKGCATVLVVVVVLAAIALAIAYYRSDNDCAQQLATTPENPMKAIVRCEYGSPAVLRLQTIEKPVPAAGELLVKVHSASVNPLDLHYMRGEPLVMRLDGALRKPKITRLGVDFSGTVEAVGPNVTQFKPGDAVFGGRFGSFAEYVTVSAANVARKPDNITFDEAAAVQVAAITALQALRDKARVQPGQRVLINGASGGVGTFAVQIAKTLGAHVTGVSSTRNLDLVRSLGADEVIDYTKQDYTKGTEKYDAVIDMVGNHPVTAHKRVLAPNGAYVMVGGPKGRWVAPMDRVVTMMVISPFTRQRFGMMLAQMKKSDLDMLSGLLQEGNIKPVIDRRYPLSDAPKAVEYLETGRARGKVVIQVAGK